jgi:hypothetical protein
MYSSDFEYRDRNMSEPSSDSLSSVLRFDWPLSDDYRQLRTENPRRVLVVLDHWYVSSIPSIASEQLGRSDSEPHGAPGFATYY